MQDMPTGMYTRRREERQFRPQQAQPFGQMAVQWLTWEAAKNGCAIRHQVNGRGKRIGKLPVDGWCPETRTAYQFHGCFFHGCPKCYDQNETNSMNGKTMATLLEKTRCNTAYIRRHVKVVEMWECEWKEVRNESDVKTFLTPSSRPRWTMTQQQILAAVVNGTLFGMVECDVRVPEELQDYFSEMQPVFKNASVTRYDIGPFMRQYAEEHDILSKPRVMLVGSFRGVKVLLATPLLRWYLAHGLVVDRVYQIIEYEPNPCFLRFPQLDALEMKTLTKPSLPTRLNYSAIRAMGRRSPTLIGIVMSSTAPRSVHQRSSTTNGFDNWMSSPKKRTK